MQHQFLIYTKLVKRRGRGWKWSVCTIEGQIVMLGIEASLIAANYRANRALFLMLIGPACRANRKNEGYLSSRTDR
jgi:hypothetical protein